MLDGYREILMELFSSPYAVVITGLIKVSDILLFVVIHFSVITRVASQIMQDILLLTSNVGIDLCTTIDKFPRCLAVQTPYIF